MEEMCDFSGYATKANIRCTDGRVIKKDAFKDDDNKKVPLVWQHLYDEPDNVLGYAVLEHRDDGMYARCTFNGGKRALQAKELVKHGDITQMSIYANHLIEEGHNVIHGSIKEVSLVLAGANSGAFIDNISMTHSDGSIDESDDEAIIYTGLDFSTDEVEHEDSDDSKETVGDVWNTLSEKQKECVGAIISQIIEMDESDEEDDEELQQSDKGGDDPMKKNVFDDQSEPSVTKTKTLSHDDFMKIVDEAKRNGGSLKEAFLAHDDMRDFLAHAETNGVPGVDYGIANLDVLMPEYRNVRGVPDMIKREDAWVSTVMGGTNKTPFSRIKTTTVDVTAEAARARGYKKGTLKKEEVIKMAKRVTGPTTIYKKQKMDRDDIVDITSFDVVTFLKSEMQMMLREEAARAILVSDGRDISDPDKINEDCIRPIYKEDEYYAYHVDVDLTASDTNARYKNLINEIALSMLDYKGSGSPILFTTKHHHIMMKMVEDAVDHKLYPSESALTDALGVSRIVDVPVMENIVNPETGKTLVGIIVDLRDYTIGMDRGGATTFFDDFDIDYNQYKYLYETRFSGALTRVDSAVIIETKANPAFNLSITPIAGGSTTVGSVTANELQENVFVSNTNVVNGILKYKSGFTDFSKAPEFQEGHYLALKIANGAATKSSQIYVELTNSLVKGAKKLDADGIAVFRITDEMKQKLKVTVTGDGETETKTYSLTGLRLAAKEE